MPVPKLQDLLQCIQDQFANGTENQRNVVDVLNFCAQSSITGQSLQHQIEAKFLDDGVPTGLFNIGNTCFANAAIQALLVCTPFTGYFIDHFDWLHSLSETRSEPNPDLPGGPLAPRRTPPYIAAELSQVISALLLLRNENDSFSPSRLLTWLRRLYPQFVVGHQHDAQEFISCLLDRLHEELQYPVLQLTEELMLREREEEDEMVSSTQSDYESCISLISEDSLYSLNVEDTVLAPMEGGGAGPFLGRIRSVDGSSAQDSGTTENGIDLYADMSPSDQPAGLGSPSSLSHDLAAPLKSPSTSAAPVRRSRIVTWRSIIRDLFYGDFAVSVECKNCGEISTRYEGFQMLEVSIPSADQLADFIDDGTGSLVSDAATQKSGGGGGGGILRWPKWMSLKAPHTRRRVNLMACLRHEFKPEYLTGDNRYRCDACRQSTDAVKNTRISRLPDVLVVHLKRFKYESAGSFLMNFSNPDRKIHDLVDFPCDQLLDPTAFNVDFTTKYELRSVISHSGSTLSSGHYTTYVKVGTTPSDPSSPATWYTCNDADVHPVPSSTVTDSEAYMLFYVKVDHEKQDKLDLLHRHLSHHPPAPSDPPETPTPLRGQQLCSQHPLDPPDCATSPHSLQLFSSGIFGSFSDPSCPLVSKEWWSELKWSQSVHRLTAQDFLCPHRLFLPGVLARLPELCIPLQLAAFEKLMDLFDGLPACRVLHRMECAVCAQTLNLKGTSAGGTGKRSLPAGGE